MTCDLDPLQRPPMHHDSERKSWQPSNRAGRIIARDARSANFLGRHLQHGPLLAEGLPAASVRERVCDVPQHDRRAVCMLLHELPFLCAHCGPRATWRGVAQAFEARTAEARPTLVFTFDLSVFIFTFDDPDVSFDGGFVSPALKSFLVAILLPCSRFADHHVRQTAA